MSCSFAGTALFFLGTGAGSPGSTLHFGPGHCSVVNIASGDGGKLAVVYAAEVPAGNARNMMLDTVHWPSDGWATMVSGGGYPSNSATPTP